MKVVVPEQIGDINTKRLSDFIEDCAVLQIVDNTKSVEEEGHYLSAYILPDMSKTTAPEQGEMILGAVFSTLVQKNHSAEFKKILGDQFEWVNMEGLDTQQRSEAVNYANKVVGELHTKYGEDIRKEHDGDTITTILETHGLGLRMFRINGIAGMQVDGREVLAK